jgi:hypothetical protein
MKNFLIFLSIPFLLNMTFATKQEATAYVMKKRLDLQRFYEDSSCKEKLDIDGKIHEEKWGSWVAMKVLIDDTNALADCTPDNKEKKLKRAQHEFIICDKEVKELKNFSTRGDELPIAPTQKCSK